MLGGTFFAQYPRRKDKLFYFGGLFSCTHYNLEFYQILLNSFKFYLSLWIKFKMKPWEWLKGWSKRRENKVSYLPPWKPTWDPWATLSPELRREFRALEKASQRLCKTEFSLLVNSVCAKMTISGRIIHETTIAESCNSKKRRTVKRSVIPQFYLEEPFGENISKPGVTRSVLENHQR